ncbi:DUF421 domain-containing protein [Sphingobium lactosutens]|uniref:DUF421 domain-containing protein n=1 Tax=Sphingobium lactosutens DS20 TaxID=1331060 RepID=T0H3H4_9SPHN|nr:YetF domain-containing protein [Sphingobium lactosutens]EQB10906.1 hypothetical protein RLDS_26080 [Sphingobium lactosutens DS20]
MDARRRGTGATALPVAVVADKREAGEKQQGVPLADAGWAGAEPRGTPDTSMLMFFDSLHGLLRVLIISLLAYAWLVFVLRLSGKRSLAKLNAFDLVVTVALGSTLATVLLTKDVAFAEGALAFCMLALLQWIVAQASIRSSWFSDLVRSRPRLLVEDGDFRDSAMRDERVTRAEVEASIRKSGIGRIEEVGAVVLESDGSMSVLERSDGAYTVLRSVAR